MASPISPLYTATEQYLDVVEKGQRVVAGLVDTYVSRLHELTPDQLTGLVAKVAPKPEDLDRGYAIVNRAVKLQQDFARELFQSVVGVEAGVGEQVLGRDAKRLRQRGQHPKRRLVQTPLDLAQVGVGDACELGKLAQREPGELALRA